MISVVLDDASPVPPYEQLRSQIAAAIQLGLLEAGQPLPTVRQLAADLSLAPNTVGRAYKELEQAGLLTTRGRRGTAVADVTADPAVERRVRLAAAAARYAAEVAQLGATVDEAVAELRRHGPLNPAAARPR